MRSAEIPLKIISVALLVFGCAAGERCSRLRSGRHTVAPNERAWQAIAILELIASVQSDAETDFITVLLQFPYNSMSNCKGRERESARIVLGNVWVYAGGLFVFLQIERIIRHTTYRATV